MTDKERFELCLSGKWITAGKNIQYKCENRVLAFQATASWSDWLLNVIFFAVPYKGTFVHLGFLLAWLSIKDEIEKLEFDIVLGFSMGGSLALLTHRSFVKRFGFQPETTVFGCPKILFMPSRLVKKRFSQVRNIHNKEDIVAKLVPWCSSVGEEIILDKPVERIDAPFFERLSGHSPKLYRARLK